MVRRLAILMLCSTGFAAGESGESIVKRWLATNKGVNSLKIEFTQTRRLTSLKSAIRRNGILWLDHAGNRFRWQTGEPPRTIVTKQGGELLIVRPAQKKHERRSAGQQDAGGLAVLAHGFPRSWEAFRKKYRLVEVDPKGESYRIRAQPNDEASRGVKLFTFVVDQKHCRLQAIEVHLRDGSRQQIVFDKIVVKAPIAEDLFQPDLTGYQATKF